MTATPACGVDAVGVESCRTIEFTRCEQAPACPQLKVTNVDACKRFYRDQCLHGLALSSDPGAPTINTCRQAIVNAAACARAGTTTTCGGYHALAEAVAPCDVLAKPERTTECSFLVPPVPAAGGSAGASGAGGGSGAAGVAGNGGSSATGGTNASGGTAANGAP